MNEENYGDPEARVKMYYTGLSHHIQVRYLEMLRLLDMHKKGNRLLEVGSNIGFTLYIASKQGYEVTGCEINERSRKVSEALYGMTVEPDFFKMSGQFDVIIMNDVLEHFPEPSRALTQAHHLLNKEGILFVQLPNIASERSRKLKGNWEFLIPPDHTSHFTVRSLQLMAEKNQLERLWHRTVNSIEDFRIISVMPSGIRTNLLYLLHHNPWYWPKFYPRKNDRGSLIQMIFRKP